MDFKEDEEDRFYGLYKIAKTEEYYLNCNEYLENKKNMDSWNFFNEKSFRIAGEFVSYRVINHWEEMGLLPNTREEKGKWRQYSLMDVIWIHIIKELRNWGVSLEQILNVRKTLCAGRNQCEYGDLEYYTALAYYNKIPVNIIVYQDEAKYKAELAALHEILDTEKKYGLGNHLSFSLNSLLASLIPDKDLKPCYERYGNLSKKESEIYKIIRDKKVEELSIIKDRKGEIDRITFCIIEEADSNINLLKRKNEFQTVSVTQRGGKTVGVKRNVSKYLK
jgi:DNA-binding transcriptional MerR regulator